jgi:DNA-binding PadR family transcriptional regulator
MMKSPPPLTPLQFAVVKALLDGEVSGEDLRSNLASHSFKKSGPGFYQLMQRMAEAGFVDSKKVPVVIGDQTYYERRYKLTAAGVRARNRTIEFYSPAPATVRGGLANA